MELGRARLLLRFRERVQRLLLRRIRLQQQHHALQLRLLRNGPAIRLRSRQRMGVANKRHCIRFIDWA